MMSLIYFSGNLYWVGKSTSYNTRSDLGNIQDYSFIIHAIFFFFFLVCIQDIPNKLLSFISVKKNLKSSL